MFTSAAILLSYFGEERSGGGGGGTPDLIHAYVKWGVEVSLESLLEHVIFLNFLGEAPPIPP